jgi:hypothetical protein
MNKYPTADLPIGTTSPKALYNNASNLDDLLLGDAPAYPDRLGRRRQSWAGMELDFATFLSNSGYETPVPYAPGISLIRPTQTVTYLGELYSAKQAALPFTTTTWASDEAKFVARGDAALRQELADPSGAGLSGFSMSESYLAGSIGAAIKGFTIPVTFFGAVADNATDCGVAANASIAALGYAFFPVAYGQTFRILTTINIGSNQALIGAGRTSTLLSSITAGHTIVIADFAENYEIGGFTLTRPLGNYGNTTGHDGIHCVGYSQLGLIRDIRIYRHWKGMYLGPTSYSEVRDYLVDNCYSHGVHAEGTSTIAALQWTFNKGISQRCNGYGMLFSTVVPIPGGPAGASMGDMSSVSTYGNLLGGIAWIGRPECGINAIRVHSAFVGEEGSHGIHLDTYGVSTIKLSNVFSEICGTLACGVDGTTPATNQGRGFNITANNTEVVMTGCNSIGNSWCGLTSAAPRVSIVGGSFRLNGAALLAGEITGIFEAAGWILVNGTQCNGNKGFGIYLATDSYHTVVGNNVRENVIGGLGSGVTQTLSQIGLNVGA